MIPNKKARWYFYLGAFDSPPSLYEGE